MDQIWSWVLMAVGLVGFHLAGKKIWWAWYVNIANQIIWFVYSIVTEQWGFLVGTFFYMYVFVQNAYRWTKEHRELTGDWTSRKFSWHPYIRQWEKKYKKDMKKGQTFVIPKTGPKGPAGDSGASE